MYNPYIPENIIIAARKLRHNMTKSEKIVWGKVKNKQLGYKFLRQRPLYLYKDNNSMDRYIIPDFICYDLKLILEIDGKIHNIKDIYNLDREKEKLLSQKGYKIIRIENKEILNDLKSVTKKIVASFP